MNTSNNESNLSNLKVDSYTSYNPYFVEEHTPILEIEELMIKEEIRHVPVVKDQKAIGIITQRDLNLLKTIQEKQEIKAKDIMLDAPYTVQFDSSLFETAFYMSENKIGSAIVNDENGKISGIFTVTDALNALIEILRGDTIE